jgi:hypothetical protein
MDEFITPVYSPLSYLNIRGNERYMAFRIMPREAQTCWAAFVPLEEVSSDK